ncbi:MAG: Gfo/Idh/MocA family oxidoreductase, partial [Planctomycetota bacterium]
MSSAASSPIRTAIVGCGRVARYHAAGYAKHAPRCKLVAVMDPTLDKARTFASEHGEPFSPAVYDDLSAMLQEARPDLVSVCTPPGAHASVVLAALKAGAWAYCEKPICESLEQFDAIVDAEKRGTARCCGVMQWRSAGSARHVLSLIRKGVFGRALTAACNTTWYRDDDYYAVPWRGTFAGESGGTVVSHGIHTID